MKYAKMFFMNMAKICGMMAAVVGWVLLLTADVGGRIPFTHPAVAYSAVLFVSWAALVAKFKTDEECREKENDKS